MNKLMMTVGSLALMAVANPVWAQSTNSDPASPPPATTAPSATPGPDVTAPNNSSINASQDTAPMSSKGATSAVTPAQGATQSSSDSMGTGESAKPTKTSHKAHHAKRMDTTKASGAKSTDHDAEQLNQQELGKLQPPS